MYYILVLLMLFTPIRDIQIMSKTLWCQGHIIDCEKGYDQNCKTSAWFDPDYTSSYYRVEYVDPDWQAFTGGHYWILQNYYCDNFEFYISNSYDEQIFETGYIIFRVKKYQGCDDLYYQISFDGGEQFYSVACALDTNELYDERFEW